MTTQIIAGDLVTGLIRQRAIPVKTAAAEQQLNSPGTLAAAMTLPLTDPLTGNQVPVVQQILPGRSFIGYVQDGAVLNAGPVRSFTYDQDSRLWSLSAVGLQGMFDQRFIQTLAVQNGSGAFASGSAEWDTLSYRTIMKRIVQLATSGYSGSLPIDFEPDIVDAFTRTYNATDMKTVGSALTDLTAIINGPDVAFRPYITTDGNYVRWAMVTGSSELRQTGDPWVWRTDGPVPSAIGASVTRSAETMATDAYEIGAQTTDPTSGASVTLTDHERNYLSDNTGIQWPRYEVAESRSDVSDSGTLNGYALAALQNGSYMTDTWTFKTRINAEPKLWRLNTGDVATLSVTNHPILGTATLPVRIMSISVNYGDSTASIACAPVRS